jgi:DNA polymerase-3 subunit epsilon
VPAHSNTVHVVGMTVTDMIVFDTETTGIDPATARIVTLFAGVLHADGSLGETVSAIVRPDGFEIPEETTRIHGVSQAKALAEGIPLADALTAVRQLFWDNPELPIVGQNVSFDLTILAREARRVFPSDRSISDVFVSDWVGPHRAVLDTKVIDLALDKWRKGPRKLTDLAVLYEVPLGDDAHNASADAVASGLIAQKLLAHPDIADYPLPQLHLSQVRWRREQAESLQAYLRRNNPEAVVEAGWPLQSVVDAEVVA